MALSLNAFLRVKPCRLLVLLKNASQPAYASFLAREAGMTYAHAAGLLKLLEREGMVSLEKKGRMKLARLTEKGVEFAAAVDAVQRVLEKSVVEKKVEEVTEGEKKN